MDYTQQVLTGRTNIVFTFSGGSYPATITPYQVSAYPVIGNTSVAGMLNTADLWAQISSAWDQVRIDGVEVRLLPIGPGNTATDYFTGSCMLYLGFDNSGLDTAQVADTANGFSCITTIPGVASKRYEGYTNWYIKNSLYPSVAAEQQQYIPTQLLALDTAGQTAAFGNTIGSPCFSVPFNPTLVLALSSTVTSITAAITMTFQIDYKIAITLRGNEKQQ